MFPFKLQAREAKSRRASMMRERGEGGVNSGRKLTLFQRSNFDPPAG